MTVSLARSWVAESIESLHEAALVGVVMDDGYSFTPLVDQVSDIVSEEVDGASYERLTAVGQVALVGGSWIVFLPDIDPIDLSDSDPKAGIWWALDGAGDADRLLIGFDDDSSANTAAYQPSYVDGLYQLPVESIDDAITALQDRPVLPAPSAIDAGKVPAVNETGTGYELTTPAGGAALTWSAWSQLLPDPDGSEGWRDPGGFGLPGVQWRVRSDGLGQLTGFAAYLDASNSPMPPPVDSEGYAPVIVLPADLEIGEVSGAPILVIQPAVSFQVGGGGVGAFQAAVLELSALACAPIIADPAALGLRIGTTFATGS